VVAEGAARHVVAEAVAAGAVANHVEEILTSAAAVEAVTDPEVGAVQVGAVQVVVGPEVVGPEGREGCINTALRDIITVPCITAGDDIRTTRTVTTLGGISCDFERSTT
jgi:hypothetical protein